MKRLFLILAMVVFLVVGCGGDGLAEAFPVSPTLTPVVNCYDQIVNYIETYGDPEEITQFTLGDYRNWAFAWYCQGIIVSFTWGGSTEGCEISTYTFTPIRRPK